MTTQDTALVETQIFSVQDLKDQEVERLKKLAEEAKKALETPIIDKASLKIVHDARIKLRDNRTKLNKDRKSFTAHLDEKKNSALSVEKELVGIISPIEDELLAKEEAYEKEQERIKEEKAREEQEILQKRIEALNAVEAEYIVGQIAIMSNEGFDMLLDMHKKKYEEILAERKRQEEEKKRQEEEAEKKRQEEAEALRKQKEENDIIAEENRKEAERIQKENARIAEENAQKARELAEKEKAIKDKEDEQKRQEELEKARKEGEEKARKEEEEKKAREKKEMEEKEQAEKDRIEKEEKYKKWFADNGVTTENREDYLTKTIENKVYLFKKIAEYTIPE